MQKIATRVCDEQSKRLYGHTIAHTIDNGGCTFMLSFRNSSSENRTIRYRLESAEGMASALHTAIYDPTTGAIEDLSRGEASIPLKGNS
jgi:hypothetical protein